VTYPWFEVNVLDSAPSDRSTEHAVNELFGNEPRVRYVRECRPGASRARNIGAAVGRGEIVAFTDDDAVVDSHWFAALVAGSTPICAWHRLRASPFHARSRPPRNRLSSRTAA
jgi:glycosyltransferase involved in cell wall biosynthesis